MEPNRWARLPIFASAAAALLWSCSAGVATDAPAGSPSGDGGPSIADAGADAGVDVGTTVDGSPGPSADCARAVGGSATGQEVLRFESAEPHVRVHLARLVVGPGVGESVVYAASGMWIEEPGPGGFTCAAIVETPRLNYVNSHHNFLDRAEGTAGSKRYVVTLSFGLLAGSGWDITLTVHDATTGAMTAGPVRLTTTGGRTGLNGGPSSLPVYVSELMPDNTTGWKNGAGEVSPWIEIFNPSSGDVDLGGYFLSNDPAQPQLWSFPAGTAIARHQHLVIAVSDAPGAGALTARFRLSPAGGSVRLSNPVGVSAGERVYPPLGANRSAAFSPATDAFAPAATATPGGGDL